MIKDKKKKETKKGKNWGKNWIKFRKLVKKENKEKHSE